MNYITTEKILNALRPVCDLSNISITTENKDWKGRTYKSDYVTIIKTHNIGFEVFDNEIIVFYFTGHCHFEDYSSTHKNDEDYISSAIDFLTKLFTLSIRYSKVTRGNKIKREEYFFVMQNGQEESLAGPSLRLFGGNLFIRKIATNLTWQYDKESNDFINCTPKHIDPNAIYNETIRNNIYFEIFENNGLFTYRIMKKDYDDYNGMFYWIDYSDGTKSIFDNKEKAIEAAKMKIELKMKRVMRDDYVFEIDMEKANSFYSDKQKVFDGISDYLPELTQFLASLGIDIEKPMKYDLNDSTDLVYKTFGKVSSVNGYELDFYGEDIFISVVIISTHENIITFEIFGIMMKNE